MKYNSNKGISYLTYSLLDTITHASFLRHGGTSKEPFDSLNFSISAGDNPADVKKNKLAACKACGIHQLCSLHQVHGDKIHEAVANQNFKGDGLVTNQPGIGLIVMHADCQGALFYDPIRKAIAAIHCGWRGNVCNIYQKTVEKMKQLYNCNPEDLRVAISPSLGPSASEFVNYRQELPSCFWPFQVRENYFDLWAISKMQLCNAGILEKHIAIARVCTYNNPNDFFSYRRAKKSGRNASMIAL